MILAYLFYFFVLTFISFLSLSLSLAISRFIFVCMTCCLFCPPILQLQLLLQSYCVIQRCQTYNRIYICTYVVYNKCALICFACVFVSYLYKQKKSLNEPVVFVTHIHYLSHSLSILYSHSVCYGKNFVCVSTNNNNNYNNFNFRVIFT